MEGPQQTICHSVKLPCLSHFCACEGVLPLQRFPFLCLGERHQNSMQIVPSLRFLFPTALDSMAAVPFPAGPWRGTLDGLTLRTHVPPGRQCTMRVTGTSSRTPTFDQGQFASWGMSVNAWRHFWLLQPGRDTVEHSTGHRAVPPNQKLSGPKCQQCQI